jgi:hypothetical protein
MLVIHLRIAYTVSDSSYFGKRMFLTTGCMLHLMERLEEPGS